MAETIETELVGATYFVFEIFFFFLVLNTCNIKCWHGDAICFALNCQLQIEKVNEYMH